MSRSPTVTGLAETAVRCCGYSPQNYATMDRLYRRRKKQSFPLTFHSTSRPKRALLWVLTTSFLVAAPAWPQPPGLWWCKHRDRRGAETENEAMATRQTSKQAKTKAEAKVNGEREPGYGTL